jgi:hypothetical protein
MAGNFLTYGSNGNGRGTTKDIVIDILSEEFPLNINKIYSKVKQNGAPVTYQAVRKSVNLLIDQGTLIKNNKEYLLSEKWIKEHMNFLERVEKNYFGKRLLQKVNIGEHYAEYTINTLIDSNKFWNKILEEWAKNIQKGEPRINAWQGPHAWWVLIHADHESEFIETFKKYEIEAYLLGTSNTPLDKYTLKYYTDLGMHSKALKSQPEDQDQSCYMATCGDTVIQTYYPAKKVKQLEEFYAKTKKVSDVNWKQLMDIVSEEIDMKVTVFKNPEIANKIRTDILKHF